MALMQFNDPRVIRAKTEHAHKMYDNSVSRNTRINYRCDLRNFERLGFALPASPSDIVSYLSELAQSYNPRTLERHVKAIRFWHKINKFVDPTGDEDVRRVLKGIINTYGSVVKRAKPFTFEDLLKIDEHYNNVDTLCAHRNNTLMQIGFFGAFRRSEVVAIRLEDIKFVKEGIEILIPQSKTDQKGEGQTCAIPSLDGPMCPVDTLQKWLKRSNIKKGHIFPPVSYKGNITGKKHIHFQILYNAIKAVAIAVGLENPECYSGHSLRRGFATEAARRGASSRSIQKQGRWENMSTVNKYIEDATLFEDNAASCFGSVKKQVVS